ncbi:MAG TPA: hypothetical protein PLM33_13920, partial [Acidobacteriota bacterium]|nr:hypothetical protein [Acidobacteriota bacterium]
DLEAGQTDHGKFKLQASAARSRGADRELQRAASRLSRLDPWAAAIAQGRHAATGLPRRKLSPRAKRKSRGS